jgi:uncharacterized protein with GYD domain
MATFVTLVNWTDQGIRNFKDSMKRAQAFKDMVASMGGEVKQMFWTLGAYDVVAIFEAPDDETATAAALQVGALGNVRTTTMRGFSPAEFEAIIKKTG